MASGTSGMKEVLGKVRMPKRTKEAVAMNKAYEPTQTAVQFWDEVKKELEKRQAGYKKAIDEFKSKGGEAEAVGDNMLLTIGNLRATVIMDVDGNISAVDLHVPLEDDVAEKLLLMANAKTAVFGLAKAEKALEMRKQLRDYVESDGTIVGLNHLANSVILENPMMAGISMIPDDKAKAEE
jgi:hypothetical protein